jgi:hypothetical protein
MDQQLAKLIKDVSENKRLINEVNDDNKQIAELLHSIYQITLDVSKKQDEWLNMGLKKPKTKSTKNTITDECDESNDDIKKETSTDTNSSEAVSTSKKIKPKGKKAINDSTDDIFTSNIMSYFKKRYKENTHYFDSILNLDDVEKLFKDNADKIDLKKTDAHKLTERVNILYKSMDKDQKNKIREMKSIEIEKLSAITSDDIEPVSED